MYYKYNCSELAALYAEWHTFMWTGWVLIMITIADVNDDDF